MNSDHFIKLAHKVGVPLKKLSSQNMTKINNAPQAQRKTAKFKKAVYIVEDLVFKGPYTFDDPRLMNNLRYTYAIELLEAALQLPEWERGSLIWEYLGRCDDNQYYLVAPNVGKWKNIFFDLVNTKIETNVKVVPRGEAVRRVSDIEGTELLTNDIKSAALQHLYLRFVLDIGDSGTHNVLAREDYVSSSRLIAGIDLEERRGDKKTKRRLNLLFSKLYKKHIDLYESDICKIKSLTYSELEQHTLDRLNAVGIDLEKLMENMDMWERLN
jgi:hypothetical protein